MSDPVLAIPWSGLSSADVGQLYDANFRPLRQSVLDEGAEAQEIGDSRTYRRVEASMSNVELRANARAWNISASASASSSYGYIRAIIVRRVYTLPTSVALDAAPARAAYVVSRVLYGHMYELRVTGQSASVRAQIEALAGGVEGSVSQQSATAEGFTLGLRPRDDAMAAMSATSSADIQRHFEPEGDPVPILIEFEPITRELPPSVAIAPETAQPAMPSEGAPDPQNGGTAQYDIAVLAMEFPASKPGNNWPWDPFGGAPDMRADFFIANQRILSVPAGADTISFRFREAQPFPQAVSIGPGSALRVDFWDVDGLQNDGAGSVTVTSLQSGDQWITASTNARVLVRVTRHD